jgi:hypothetical protein
MFRIGAADFGLIDGGNYETPPLGQAPAADGRPEQREKR